MTLQNIQNSIDNNLAVALYFSGKDCGVCHVLQPKIAQLISQKFPKMILHSIDATSYQEIAAHFGVFSVPTLLVFFDSKEFIRKSRNMSVSLLEEEISRPYSMLLGE